jgi:uncharacterized protein YndB with AHSA1/START domain
VTDPCVIHDTFSLERTYPVCASLVFAAFTSAEAKAAWEHIGDREPAEGPAGFVELDFRSGGRERFAYMVRGTTYRYDALYYDIVPNRRIVYSYEMYADGARISVSLATIEFETIAEGTTLTWTEQGAYLDGIDGSQAATRRLRGTTRLLDRLAQYLAGAAGDSAVTADPDQFRKAS